MVAGGGKCQPPCQYETLCYTHTNTCTHLQALLDLISDLEGKLEAEQEKLASLEKNLSGEAGPGSQDQGEGPVSEDWLHSLKERRKVSGRI